MEVAWVTLEEVLQVVLLDKHQPRSDQLKVEEEHKVMWLQEQPRVRGLTANCQWLCNKQNKHQIRLTAEVPLLDKFHHITLEPLMAKLLACQLNNLCHNLK